MLPRWHIIYGAIFTLIIWAIFPETNYIYLLATFLSSFLIDFDHYLTSLIQNKKFLTLKESLNYHKIRGKEQEEDKRKGIRKKYDFHLFHTLEFHLFVLIIGFFIPLFFYIFIGMAFHSLVDIYDGWKRDWLFRREFLFVNWIKKKIK